MSDPNLSHEDTNTPAFSAYVVDHSSCDDPERASACEGVLTATVAILPKKETGFFDKRNRNVVVSLIASAIVLVSALSLSYIFLWGSRSASHQIAPGPENEAGESHFIHKRPEGFDELAYARKLREVITTEFERRGDSMSATMLDQSAAPQRFALEWLAYEDTTILTKPRQIIQRFVLILIYFSTGGANLWDKEWIVPGLHECYFDGVECEEFQDEGAAEKQKLTAEVYEDLKVVCLDLFSRSLVSEIPRDLAMLSHLRKIDLSGNRLKGSIPEELFELTTLVELSLFSNSLVGSISDNLHKLSKLEKFSIHSNFIAGLLPAQIPPSLKYFNAKSNYIASPFHYFGKDVAEDAPRALEFIDVSSNSGITGTIPPEISRFSNLKELRVAVTAIRGSIPSEIGTLSLENFALDSVRVNGTIPEELWEITTLKSFLSDNSYSLGGTISTKIGSMKDLKLLTLGTSQITGTIPSEIGLATSLLWLSLPRTQISGTLPKEMAKLKQMTKCDLSNTFLTGTTPSGFCPQSFVMTCKNNTPVKCDCCSTCLKARG